MGFLPDLLNKWNSSIISQPIAVVIMLLINISSAMYANAVLTHYRMFPKANSLVALSIVLIASLILSAILSG